MFGHDKIIVGAERNRPVHMVQRAIVLPREEMGGSIQGRMLDLFRLPGGRLLHPYEILSDLKEDAFRWVRHYQLVQEAEGRVVFRMVPGPGFDHGRLAEFERRAAQALGPDARLRTELVERIEPGPGGKFHLARSLVPKAGDEAAAWHRSERVA